MSRAPRQSGLELDDPSRPVPTRPSWFDTAAGQENRQSFADLDELARHIVRLAGDDGLRLAAEPATVAVVGLELFPAWSCYRLTPDGGEDWLGHAAIQATPRARLEAAIARAHAAHLTPRRAA